MANAYTIKATPEATDSITISDVTGAIFKATLGSLPGSSSAVGGYVDPPVYSDSLGIKGQYSFDADYIYMCIADNSWDRFPVTWDAWGTSAPENPVVLSPVIGVSGATITLNYDRNVFQGSAYLDPDFNLDASVSGSDIGISYQSGDGTRTHIYSISTVIRGGETVNIDYNGRANGLEDLSGNDLQSILSMTVTNLSEDLYSDIIFWDGFEGTITDTAYESTNYDYPAFHTGVVDGNITLSAGQKIVGEKSLWINGGAVPATLPLPGQVPASRGSLSFWFRGSSEFLTGRPIAALWDTEDDRNYISLTVGQTLNTVVLRVHNITTYVVSDVTINLGIATMLNTWTHISIRWDQYAQLVEILVNGVVCQQFTVGSTLFGNYGRCFFGPVPTNGNAIYGYYDNLIVSTDPNRDLYALALLEAYPG